MKNIFMPPAEMTTGLLKYAIKNNKLFLKDTLKLGKKWPEKISPAGIDIDDKRNLIVCGNKRK